MQRKAYKAALNYSDIFDYGDADSYRSKLKEIRMQLKDIE